MSVFSLHAVKVNKTNILGIIDAILKNVKSVYFIESLSVYLFNLKKTYILYFIIDNFS